MLDSKTRLEESTSNSEDCEGMDTKTKYELNENGTAMQTSDAGGYRR